MIRIIDAMIRSLNRIEVHGKENLDILLGVIQTLEQLKAVIEKKAEGEKTNDDNNEQWENIQSGVGMGTNPQ